MQKNTDPNGLKGDDILQIGYDGGAGIEKLDDTSINYFQEKYKRDVLTTIESLSDDAIANDLEASFNEGLYGQSDAKKIIARAISNSITRLGDHEGPLGAFFFHGPTGVGKTEIVKVLAKEMFGDKDAFIKIDCGTMSQEFEVSTTLLGAPAGYIGHGGGKEGTRPIFNNKDFILSFLEAKNKNKLNPLIKHLIGFNIILFDEIEKAHPDIQKTLLGILNDGYVENKNKEKVDFSNSIIIFTSNLGQQEISMQSDKKTIGFTSSLESNIDRGDIFSKRLKARFKPEFIGRLSSIVEFQNITKEDSKNIIDIWLSSYNDYLFTYFPEAYLQVELAPEVYDFILEKGHNTSEGVRSFKKYYEVYFKPQIDKFILSSDFEKYFKCKGEVIIGVDIIGDELKFNVINLKNVQRPKRSDAESLNDRPIKYGLKSGYAVVESRDANVDDEAGGKVVHINTNINDIGTENASAKPTLKDTLNTLYDSIDTSKTTLNLIKILEFIEQGKDSKISVSDIEKLNSDLIDKGVTAEELNMLKDPYNRFLVSLSLLSILDHRGGIFAHKTEFNPTFDPKLDLQNDGFRYTFMLIKSLVNKYYIKYGKSKITGYLYEDLKREACEKIKDMFGFDEISEIQLNFINQCINSVDYYNNKLAELS